MKWHWIMLLVGLGLYTLVLFPGLLPHSVDSMVAILAGVTIASVAMFGFVSTHVDRRLARLLIVLSLIMLVIGIMLARQGHPYSLVVLSVPAIGMGLFGLRKIFDERKG